jgi:hypothetical protein
MKGLKLLLMAVVASVLLVSCSEEGDDEKIVEMTIYPETGYGASVLSDVWTQPLLFSDSEDDQTQMLVDIITEGFDFEYERGYEYQLKVKKVWMHDPPQDVSSIKYVFIELLSKTKTITEDSEENIELFVSPQTIKFTPKYPSEYEDDQTPKIYDALHVKETGSENWMALPEIEGFDFEENYEYVLDVKKVTQADPYSVTYTLEDIISKTEKN